MGNRGSMTDRAFASQTRSKDRPYKWFGAIYHIKQSLSDSNVDLWCSKITTPEEITVIGLDNLAVKHHVLNCLK